MSAPAWDEAALRSALPGIPWDQPVRIEVAGGLYGRWVCRVCVALHGLRAIDLAHVPYAFDSRSAALDHLERAHHE